jgi:Tol biopolymer transport system component
MTFLRFNPTTLASSLWVADADGHNPQMIVADDVFLAMLAPRFSPDEKWILFSESGPPSHPLPGALLHSGKNCEPALLCALAEPALADGLPWDLWLVSVDGRRFQQLTNVGFDSPWPAWSRDGRYIAIFETSGFYILDVERRLLSMWRPDGGHGVMDWWTPK